MLHSRAFSKWFIFIGVAMIWTLNGCGTFSRSREQNLYQVHLGQSRVELVEALGEPARESQDGGQEKWFYQVYSYDRRQTYPYTAIFEHGKLTHWDFDTSRTTENLHAHESRNPSSQDPRY